MKWTGDKIAVAMNVRPMGMLLMTPAGWIKRHQQDVIVHVKLKTIV